MNNENESTKVKKEFLFLDLDKSRRLKYGLKALKLLEEKYKVPILGALEKIMEDFNNSKTSVDDIIYLLWVGLTSEDKDLTVEDLVVLIENSEYDFMGLLNSVISGIGMSVEDVGGKDEKKLPAPMIPKKKKAGTGKN
jgi:hypothetical protein